MKIFIHAKARAKNVSIEKIDETHFTVSVQEPPVKGLANRSIRKVIADYFSVSLGKVYLVSGFSSRTKVFEVNNG